LAGFYEPLAWPRRHTKSQFQIGQDHLKVAGTKNHRRPALRLAVAAVVVLVVGIVLAAGIYAAGRTLVLHDVASVVRMPIPGTADAKLDRRDYGLYFGLLNAPTGKAIHVPRVRITIVPPDNVADPDFVEVPREIDVYVDGFHTVQVARISVHTPGRYHLHVESPDEFGGSFSIGEMPRVLDPDRALARAIPFGLAALILSALLAVATILVRRCETRGSRHLITQAKPYPEHHLRWSA
jgi:hypothetical protein